MIDELETLLTGFSKVNHTWCFLHVNNLVAKTFVTQFDTTAPKKTVDPSDPNYDLYKFSTDVDREEQETREALLVGGEEGAADDDDTTGWEDEMAALDQAEHEILEESLRPVKKLLAKVREHLFPATSSYLRPSTDS
jgi:hypothetical protein